ncbi:hypothetical protein QCD61_19240 [Pseudomonas viciae]|uniref:Uncharacterized protein n=1 Tax=Pseudomonas viciae TaxID=2505979 RepID=A0ABY8P9D9_9PSED|nr:hypothetical protein [Pseudomonas viciae]WGO91832.1 hypothetical protein QCD61_19240 [Pseudomonas viciae]
MKRTVAALTVSLCIVPSTAFSGWLDKKEQVVLSPKLSIAQEISKDTYLKTTTSTQSLTGMCNDSFLHALSRNVIGANGKTLVVLTYDSIPLLKVEYNQKTRTCNREFLIESDLTSYILSSKAETQHKFNLIYAADEEVTTLENALYYAKPFITAASPAGALVGLPIAKDITNSLDSALAKAASPHANQTAGFVLPDSQNQTKLTLYATIGSQDFLLMDLYLNTRKSLLDGISHEDIMDLGLDGPLGVKDAILNQRSKNGAAFKAGDYDIISNECGFLRNSYQKKLNTLDMRRLQEAYILENHRDMVTPKVMQQCFGYTIENPQQYLTFKILADMLTPSTPILDTFFLKLLTTGEHEKILSPTIKISDRNTNLRIANVSDYIGLRDISSAACHTSLSQNQVGFIQSIGNQPYYLTASVDRLYSKEEAGQGKLPAINNISISTSLDEDYRSIPGVMRCINDWNQSRRIASSW